MAAFSLRWPFRSSNSRTSNSMEPKPIKSDEAKMNQKHREIDHREELLEYGITDQLVEFVKGFDANTFKNFPIQDVRLAEAVAENSAPSSNKKTDLTEWQERHAMLLLSKVKEISRLRYYLCPRYLKDEQFWRIYFLLVKDHVAPYEIQAIKKAKIKRMSFERDGSANTAIEVEMMETRTSKPQ